MKRVASVASRILIAVRQLGKMRAQEGEPTMRGCSFHLDPSSAGIHASGSAMP